MRFAIVSGLLLSLTPVAAIAAAPGLVTSIPADGAIVSHPTTIRLSFDQDVNEASATLSLKMTSMPGMRMAQPMVIALGNPVSAPKALVVDTRMPLPAGKYSLEWSIANAAREISRGTLDFSVR